jgi:hypothetical protein
MTTPRSSRILTTILLFVLAVSCGVVPGPARDTSPRTGNLPAVSPTIPFLAAVQPPSGFSIILGRPTETSITTSLLCPTDQQVVIAYGTASGQYTAQTAAFELKAAAPQNIELTGLQPDTAYFYTVLFNGAPSGEHTFHTRRAAGSTFTFTIDADPHNRDPNANGELYAIALTNALTDRPDFHINLGDTFMTEKVQATTYAEAETTFTDMRPYFGIIGADAPLFLVNGNHEGELGWALPGRQSAELPIWSTQLRQLYYPNPVPNDFYSGSSSIDPALGSVRDGYYAWTWGDALFVVLDPYWYTTSKPSPEDPNTNWNWTLGKEQYDWLRSTLENSNARFKFIFIHNLVGGNAEGRGGIEVADLYEWGGNKIDGSYGFDDHRPGWGMPIHQLLVQNDVSAVFHGHDHVFVQQELDGIIYQEVPQPDTTLYNKTSLADEFGYVNGVVFGSSGHLRVTVAPDKVTVEYVRAYLPKDEKSGQVNGQVDFSYIIK